MSTGEIWSNIIEDVIQDSKITAEEATQLNDFISLWNTNSVDTKWFSDKLNLTPNLIDWIIDWIKASIDAGIDATDADVFSGLLESLDKYINKIYKWDNEKVKSDFSKKITYLKNLCVNAEKLWERGKLMKEINQQYEELAALNSNILLARTILQFADTDQAVTLANIKITRILGTTDISSVEKTFQENLKKFQEKSKELKIFDKKNPNVVSVLNYRNEKGAWSIDGLKTNIDTKLNNISPEWIFTSMKWIKDKAFVGFVNGQKEILKSLPNDQVIPYIASLKEKMIELKTNPNLNDVEKKNLENLFNGVLADIDGYIVSNNIEVPQLSQQEYLGKISHDWLFENPSYKKAFDACFDDAKSGRLDSRFDWFINQYISGQHEAPEGKQLSFKKEYIVVGAWGNQDPELSTYPRETRVIVVTPMVGDVEYKQDGSKVNKSYITFGKNETVDQLKYTKFESMYQNVGGKDMLNWKEFDWWDFNSFDKWWVKAFSLRLWKQWDDVFTDTPWLNAIFVGIDDYKNGSNSNDTEIYKKWFLDAVVADVIKRAPTNNVLFQQYINLISSKNGLNLKYLGYDDVQQKANHQLLSDFIKTNKRLEKWDEAQKQLAITIWSIWLVFQSKEAPKTFQETIKEYANALFKSPIGKMIFGLIDTFFGWKWWFLAKFKDIKGFEFLSESVNKQFKEQYGLSENQLNIIGEIHKDAGFNKNVDKNFVNSFEKPAEDVDWINKLVDLLKNKWDHLDINIFKNFVKNWKIVLNDDDWKSVEKDISTVFMINDKWEYSLKNDIDPTVLKLVLKQSVIKDAVLKTDGLLKSQGVKDSKVDYGNAENTKWWIQTETDYAVYLSAYLMWWSKWKGLFHYVISENNLWHPPLIVAGKDNIAETPEQKFDKIIADLKTNNIPDTNSADKIQWYEFKKPSTLYAYEASDKITVPKKDYQEKVLDPMSKLFDVTKWTTDGAKSNFEMFLWQSEFSNDKAISETIFKDSYNLRNMFVYMNKWEKQNLQFSNDVIQGIVNMTNVKKEGNTLIFSNVSWAIKVSVANDKLNAVYEDKKK